VEFIVLCAVPTGGAEEEMFHLSFWDVTACNLVAHTVSEERTVSIIMVGNYTELCFILARRLVTSFKPGSGNVGFVVDEVALEQIFSAYFDFPCQSSSHRLLHAHHVSSGAGTKAN
jgi:hypothetical protein